MLVVSAAFDGDGAFGVAGEVPALVPAASSAVIDREFLPLEEGEVSAVLRVLSGARLVRAVDARGGGVASDGGGGGEGGSGRDGGGPRGSL